MRRRWKILLVALIIVFAPLAVNALAALGISVRPLALEIVGSEGGEANAVLTLEIDNRGILPAHVLGGWLDLELSGVRVARAQVRPLLLTSGSHIVKIPLRLCSTIIEAGEILTVRIAGLVFAPLPVPVSVSRHVRVELSPPTIEDVSCVGSKLSVIARAELPFNISGCELSLRARIGPEHSPITAVGATQLNGREVCMELEVTIPSNESLQAVFDSALKNKPVSLVAEVTLRRGTWSLTLYVRRNVTIRLRFNCTVEVTGAELVLGIPPHLLLNISVVFINRYSIEILLLWLRVEVRASGVLLAEGKAENQVIPPRSEARVNMTLDVILSKEGLDAIRRSEGKLDIGVEFAMRVCNVTYIVTLVTSVKIPLL